MKRAWWKWDVSVIGNAPIQHSGEADRLLSMSVDYYIDMRSTDNIGRRSINDLEEAQMKFDALMNVLARLMDHLDLSADDMLAILPSTDRILKLRKAKS